MRSFMMRSFLRSGDMTRTDRLPIRTMMSLLRGPVLDSNYVRSDGDRTTKTQAVLQLQNDLRHVQTAVRSYDPAGTLPGRMLPSNSMQLAYYAIRSFWVETGLRFDPESSRHKSPQERLDWWEQGIEDVFLHGTSPSQENRHPTLRLLSHLHHNRRMNFTKSHFDDVLKSRRADLDLRQYPDVQALRKHAVWSCGSLFRLLLESSGQPITDDSVYHEIAEKMGVCHGLANALRTSIPVLSTTGKLVLPHDLCAKHGVSSPRYLLSALGMGDENCKRAMKNVVHDIVKVARNSLAEARTLRPRAVPALNPQSKQRRQSLNSVFLPGLASEAFLDRLEKHNFDLTDRNLRNVSTMEHWTCGLRMVLAAYQDVY